MWLMLQQDEPDDFVIATGETHSVREFLELAFSHVGLDYRDYVTLDPQLYRKSEVHRLVGDSSKARARLGWTYPWPLSNLVREMVNTDLEFHNGVARGPNGSSTIRQA
jgi:GDPmannose 4,6-dehydratase